MAPTYRVERDRGSKEFPQQLVVLRERWPLAFPTKHEDAPISLSSFGANGSGCFRPALSMPAQGRWLFPSSRPRVRPRLKRAGLPRPSGTLRRRWSVAKEVWTSLNLAASFRHGAATCGVRANITSLPRFAGAFSWWRRNCACFNVLKRVPGSHLILTLASAAA
jgi:hypothetical protein